MHVFFSPTPDDDGATLLVRLDGVCGFAIVVSRDVLLSSPLVVVVKVVLVVVPPALREEEEEEEEEIRIYNEREREKGKNHVSFQRKERNVSKLSSLL